MYRRAYQRAVSVPTPALEQLWSSYERFEQSGSNKSLGRYTVCLNTATILICCHMQIVVHAACQLLQF